MGLFDFLKFTPKPDISEDNDIWIAERPDFPEELWEQKKAAHDVKRMNILRERIKNIETLIDKLSLVWHQAKIEAGVKALLDYAQEIYETEKEEHKIFSEAVARYSKRYPHVRGLYQKVHPYIPYGMGGVFYSCYHNKERQAKDGSYHKAMDNELIWLHGYIAEMKKVYPKLKEEVLENIRDELFKLNIPAKYIEKEELLGLRVYPKKLLQIESLGYFRVNRWKSTLNQLANMGINLNNKNAGFAENHAIENLFSKDTGIYIGGGYHFNGDGHLLTVGGTGAGKGANFIIPALLSPALVASGSSVVVLDPKGENLAICGEHLQRAGYKVLAINPFNIPEISNFGKVGFNPFSLTSKNDKQAPKFCDLIAECLIPDAGANAAHWTDSARQYISLYLLYMVATDQSNFKNLFEAVRLGGADRLRYLDNMLDCSAFGGIISATAGGIAAQLSQKDGSQEIESIYSTIRRGTDIFKDEQLTEHLSGSDFDLTKIAHEKTALFICVNPAELQIFGAWLRVFFGCVFRTLQKHYNPDRRVLLLMDEFPQIGRLKEFEMAVAYMRGYNVTIWAIIQDLSQLKKLYWDSWETFVGSAAVKMWLPLGADNSTLNYLEQRMPILNVPEFDPAFIYNDDKPITNYLKQTNKKLLNLFELSTCNNAIIEARGLGNFAKFEKNPYWSLEWGKNASPNPFRR